MNICPIFESCPFLEKFRDTMPDTIEAVIKVYCKGEQRRPCQRYNFRDERGYPPPDDLMPNGDRLLG